MDCGELADDTNGAIMSVSTTSLPPGGETLSQHVRDAWTSGRREDARMLADRLAETAAERGDAAGLHLAAAVALACGLPELALARLDAALPLVQAAGSAPLWNDRGRALLALGRAASAANDFRRALAVDPGLVAARFNLGAALAAQGDLDAAIAQARCCIADAPDFAPAYPLLASWLADRGEHAAALPLLFDAVRRWPADPSVRSRLVDLLKSHPDAIAHSADDEAPLVALLRDADVDAQQLTAAGWLRLARDPGLARLIGADGHAEDPATLAALLNARPLALELISQGLPPNRTIERMLSRVRRWLLLSHESDRYAALCRALAAQCRLNGGAWPVSADEAAHCRLDAARSIRDAYPDVEPAHTAQGVESGDVAARLRAQYEAHAYPVWQRITRRPPQGFAGFCGPFRDASSPAPRGRPRILVAGCGTGRHAAQLASAMPDADIVAIDVSTASLRYAEARARALGISTISFACVDLHDAASLGGAFDHIECGGVLHHLADPEAGWRALMPALAPGGTMRIGLYSALARRGVAAARRRIADLVVPPCDDDALRAARARLLALPHDDALASVWRYTDFYSLAGFRDLMVNEHEDPFDIPRIARALTALGLAFLGFDQLDPDTHARKRALLAADDDADLAGWAAFEEIYPDTFRAMYQFWCRPA
ncbi:methyltransferase domain-containing protein [Burkholderia sp. F1]|uniref:methyltransferase domain-containing protein n=1 Tax=Burkholderia sp. F1 TaxID=3366817 RepID=UPI003D75EFFD